MTAHEMERMGGKEREIISRLSHAGKVLRDLPNLNSPPATNLNPNDVGMMDEVLGDWLPRLGTKDQRRIISWYIVGIPWRRAAEKDLMQRTPEALRHAFYRAVRKLAISLDAAA